MASRFNNTNIYNNKTTEASGGGLYTLEDVDITSSQIHENQATYGGGIFIGERSYAPIGSVLCTMSSENPATLLGYGTWEEFAAGRMLIGVNESDSDFATALKTGGAKTHTLTINEMPSHNHSEQYTTNRGKLGSSWFLDPGQTGGSGTSPNAIQYTGGSSAHGNLQPYITCYMWRRTA